MPYEPCLVKVHPMALHDRPHLRRPRFIQTRPRIALGDVIGLDVKRGGRQTGGSLSLERVQQSIVPGGLRESFWETVDDVRRETSDEGLSVVEDE